MRWNGFCIALTVSVSQVALGSEATVGRSVPTISLADRLQWLLALLIVLGVLFLCVWMLRKLGAVNSLSNSAKIHIVGGISLGIREKVVLLQVGKKQLVLAVTPGRIETLTVLEGDECLDNNQGNSSINAENSFAQKLMQSIKGQPDA